MTAELRRYYDDNPSDVLTCPTCGWSDEARHAHAEYFREVMHYECPRCQKMLRVVGYPTIEEMRAHAAAGNEKAIRELAEFERLSEQLGDQRPD